MATGNIDSWGGNISEIGPLYPFVGSEFALFIVAMVLWIVWHIVQARAETKGYEDEIARFGNKENLQKILDAEDPYTP